MDIAAPTPEDADATIGGRIRLARKEKGLNQGDLAARLGVSQPTVANWEADAHSPRQSMLVHIGDVLGVSLGWLAGGEARDRLDPHHPAASYLARPISHVPVLPAEMLTNRRPLLDGSAISAAIDFVPVSLGSGSLFGFYAETEPHDARFPGRPLFIFDHQCTQPEADQFALCATAHGPQLHQWSTRLVDGPGGEVLGTLKATLQVF